MIYSDGNDVTLVYCPARIKIQKKITQSLIVTQMHKKKKHEHFCQKVFCLFIDLKYEYDQHT